MVIGMMLMMMMMMNDYGDDDDDDGDDGLLSVTYLCKHLSTLLTTNLLVLLTALLRT
jgi:hypothetical protein